MTATMSDKRHQHDAVHWHMNEITSRVVAQSGIPSDRFHHGKIILQCLKDDPDMVLQIDGATNESETNASVLKRSIQCAIAFRKLGLQRGDVMVLMAPNHLDLAIPFYAALYEGIIISPVDRFLGVCELQNTFAISTPKIIFCQNEKLTDIQAALRNLMLNAKVIIFAKGDQDDTFSKLLEQGDHEKEIQNYKPADFNPAETIATLIPTSGTTGLPKASAATHKTFTLIGPYCWARATEFPFIPIPRHLIVASLQWSSAILNFIFAPYMKFTRLQSSLPETQQHVYHLINSYRPCHMIASPTLMTTLLKPGDRDNCDFTCFKSISLGGSAVYEDLIEEVKKVSPETETINVYGMTELSCIALGHGLSSPPSSCGKPLNCFQYRLVDVDTGNDIHEPNKNGELWIKGPAVFNGYYNNPEATAEVLEDGWFKTGDILYRDEAWNFYFVERIKLLLRYKGHQISPAELEAVIRQHPGVLDVAVTSVPDPECGDLAVACVVPKPGQEPSAQEIKDLVKESLTSSKQLRGGVVFMNQLPTTASTKVHRKKIKELVLSMKRE